ncbi:3,4-dihydroxyphenylacetate 2,3-dioxygenase [Agrobacterium rhizogenes]|nr:3,4-dihydroxyphenylacetate 2,3-dioxygenase [Rhizobium rhizogenes]NTH62025.1 3,4-dihydroxyphenylacetate 2,3-dioxygenase [Rhizobium rhizogenes]NTH93651.1 3,4-dihydroxyphenylacetate 2,3-dioxygenase [Rhizobium rhizogenes]
MPIPKINLNPPFNITRCSHVCLEVHDLAASRLFYEQVIGLIVTAEEDGVLYLRGVEEACHHSLVLQQVTGDTKCSRIGMRVLTEEDLDKAFAHFSERGCEANWVEVAYQGRTLNVTETSGIPLQLCARMPIEPRQITSFHNHRGGVALRLDHYQILVPDLFKALNSYMELGFWLTEYVGIDHEKVRAVFLQRKGNPHDIVFFNGDGPRIHHFAFMTTETQNLLRACDVAGELGFGRQVERGPGRHGPGHALFVYFRDPDGHRVELFNTHYQVMDLENEPIRWDPHDPAVAFPWGMPARQRWFDEATEFRNVAVRETSIRPTPMTLERYLQE